MVSRLIYLHQNSQRQLDNYCANPAQSLLISGERGIGFEGTIASIASSLGVRPIIYYPQKDGKLNREEGSIGIETIRMLYEQTARRSQAKQLIVLDDADTMSIPAQNAFLKLLEEPSATTYFILLSHTPQKLLSTIRSRLSDIVLAPITSAQSEALLNELHVTNATKRRQLLFIADGYPALLTKLAQDDTFFMARSRIMRDARTMIQGTHYEMLKVIDTYKTREDALLLLKDASRLLEMNMTATNAAQVIARLKSLLKAYEMIEQNGNRRLWLTQSMV